jgi:hypothetical protein
MTYVFGRVGLLGLGAVLVMGCGKDGDGDGDGGGTGTDTTTASAGDSDGSSSVGTTVSSGGASSGSSTAATTDCPPCAAPPHDSCVGSGPCGCGPFTCDPYIPCLGAECGDGQQCLMVNGSQTLSACGDTCMQGDSCPDGAGGTAVPLCSVEDDACVLDCGEGRTCPDGMECLGLNQLEVCLWPGG